MELYATIKKTSEYAHQGHNPENGQAILFPVESIQDDHYAFRLNCNQYRREDLTFWVKTPRGRLVRLNGGG